MCHWRQKKKIGCILLARSTGAPVALAAGGWRCAGSGTVVLALAPKHEPRFPNESNRGDASGTALPFSILRQLAFTNTCLCQCITWHKPSSDQPSFSSGSGAARPPVSNDALSQNRPATNGTYLRPRHTSWCQYVVTDRIFIFS